MEPPLIQDAFLPPVTEQDRPHCRGGATVAQEKTNARPPGGEWSPDRDRDAPTPGLEPRLFPYIWRHSKRDQLAICMVVLASVPFYFASLDLPKRIVNDAIIGKAFAHGEATAPFLNFEIAWPAFLGGGWTEIFNGFHADRQGLLLWLSGLFLILVLINGAFKFRINLQKGVLGERMLRRLRFQLFSLMLRFTPETQREVKSSETATIIRDEVEPIGSFIGDAIVVPAQLGTHAATALAFILMQNVWLGLAAGAIAGVQIAVIPRLRHAILRLSRQRQIESRNLAGRVAEVLDGLDAVTVNDSVRWERAEISGRLHGLYDLRLQIYRRKFAIKYLNNLLAQVTPFLFYAVGGLLALKGELSIGQLVAVLAAYRDLPPPLKGLIDWDQQRLDVEVKYEAIAAHFGAQRLRLADATRSDLPQDQTRAVTSDGLVLRDPKEGRSVTIADLHIALPAQVGLHSPGTGLAHQFARALAGLQSPVAGAVSIGALNLVTAGRAARARRIGYAGRDPVLFPGTIRDNLVYGLRTAPQSDLEDTRPLFEAHRAGNSPDPVDTQWVDLAALGASDTRALDLRMLDLLSRLGMDEDLYRFGLTATSRCEGTPLGERMIAARRHLHRRLVATGKTDLVLPFDLEEYNQRATVAENLLFGVPTDPALVGQRLASEPRFRAVLAEHGLLRDLDRLGVAVARTLVEISRGLPPGHALFRCLPVIDQEALPEIERRLAVLGDRALPDRPGDDVFLTLALSYIEPSHRLGLLDRPLCRRIVGARGPLQTRLHSGGKPDIAPFDPGRINMRSSMLDNLLFGRVDTTQMNAEVDIQEHVRAAVRHFGLEGDVRVRGLDYGVGNRGRLLTVRQQASIELARAVLRQPDLLVLDGTLRHLEDCAGVIEALTSGPLAPESLLVVTDTAEEAALLPVQVTVERSGAVHIAQASSPVVLA